MNRFTTNAKAFVLTTLLIAVMPVKISAENDITQRQAARILIKTMAETAKKLTEKTPLALLFALQSRMTKDSVDNYISLENQSYNGKALETLLPIALAHAARTSKENINNKTNINPFYNKKLARDLMLKSVLSTLFVQKETTKYNALCKLRRLSSFFSADIFIDPANYKKHFNLIQGVSIFTGEKIAAYMLVPILTRPFSIDDDVAEMIAGWLVEDVFDKQISDIVKKAQETIMQLAPVIKIKSYINSNRESATA